MDDPLSQIQFYAPGISAIICLVASLFLLLMSAFASGSEIAFFSLTPKDLSELDSDNVKDKKILMLREDSERTLATILITNNFINVTIIMLLNYFFSQIVDFGTAYWLHFLVVTVLLTFLLLLFGEIIPKVYSRVSPLAFCRRVVNGILFFRQLFWPIGTLLLGSGIIAERFVQRREYDISADELEQALDMTDKEEIRDEKEMLEGIIRFSDEMVKEIMTSRQDIVDIDIKSSFKDVIDNIVENNYSRIPVYQGSIDNIRGILYIKDLLPHIGKANSFRWQTLIRPAHFVPETKKIDDLLREFQTNKVHIAIVVDEFGGTSGIITLEDILEEIVGEINDEYDEEEKNYTRINSNTWIFEGKTSLSDFFKILDLDDETFEKVEGDADSLAGLLLEINGDFPELHQRIDYQLFTFEVIELDGHRISKIKVVIHDKVTSRTEPTE